jgi:hypothetical protein
MVPSLHASACVCVVHAFTISVYYTHSKGCCCCGCCCCLQHAAAASDTKRITERKTRARTQCVGDRCCAAACVEGLRDEPNMVLIAEARVRVAAALLLALLGTLVLLLLPALPPLSVAVTVLLVAVVVVLALGCSCAFAQSRACTRWIASSCAVHACTQTV